MIILSEKLDKESLLNLSSLGEKETFFEDIVKCVVDIEQKLLAINAELHSDLEEYLLQNGSANKNLYGININLEDFEIEFDSLINPPRNREDGYPRAGRYVASPEVREKIIEVVNQWIKM